VDQTLEPRRRTVQQTEHPSFWVSHSDDAVHQAISQWLYHTYGFDKQLVPAFATDLHRRLFYAIHVYDQLINVGWEVFAGCVWNTDAFWDAVGYFNGRMVDAFQHEIRYLDLEEEDRVQIYAIDTEAVLRQQVHAAIRHHAHAFDPIVDELAARIAANTQRRDGIHLERWKQ